MPAANGITMAGAGPRAVGGWRGGDGDACVDVDADVDGACCCSADRDWVAAERLVNASALSRLGAEADEADEEFASFWPAALME
ncbi:hypothetical protein RA876_17585 [Rhodoferax antarcticus]|nr:hypothetical protein RA876_17585 [Rhodoferax antarcticus]